MRVMPTFMTMKMKKPAAPAMYQLLIFCLAIVSYAEQTNRKITPRMIVTFLTERARDAQYSLMVILGLPVYASVR